MWKIFELVPTSMETEKSWGGGGGEGFISSGSFSNSKKSMFDSSDYLIPGTFPILNVATLKFPLLNILGFLFYFIYFIFLHCLA